MIVKMLKEEDGLVIAMMEYQHARPEQIEAVIRGILPAYAQLNNCKIDIGMYPAGYHVYGQKADEV